jgi:hypothetical protein
MTDKIKLQAGDNDASLETEISRIAVAEVAGLSQIAETIVELAAKI